MRATGLLLATVLAAALGVAAGCARDDADATGTASSNKAAREPAQAVLLLTDHLRRNDLAAFARDAVPPELAAPLESAWREGRTRWPLEELPFDERLPGALGALSAPDAETRLRQVFDQQFANEEAAITAAASTLGLFGAEYVRGQGDYSDAERAHYLQLVEAVSRWGATAPLSDPGRADAAIATLAKAARAAELPDEAAFAHAGMVASLARLSWVSAALKEVLAGYGLALDDTLAGMRAEEVDRKGDKARVRMRYTLAGAPIEAVVEAERIDGRWYLSDFLRHARAAAAPPETPEAATDAAQPPATPAKQAAN